jgi:hypothetical protein
MDLLKTLRNKFANEIDLPFPLKIGFIPKKETMSMYTQPGSTVINADFAGNIEKSVNITVSAKSKNFEEAQNSLMMISNYVDHLNNSNFAHITEQYRILSLIQSSVPYLVEQDENGQSTFSQDFVVRIETNNNY